MTDGAYRYFEKFTSNDELEQLESLTQLDEIDAIIMDIHMDPGTLLPAKYRRSRIDEHKTGIWLTRFLGEQVAAYNPKVRLPVLMLTNMNRTDLNQILNNHASVPFQHLSKRIIDTDPNRMLATLNTLVEGRRRIVDTL